MEVDLHNHKQLMQTVHVLVRGLRYHIDWDDVTQEALLTALRCAGKRRFVPVEWLRRCVQSRALDMLRAQQRHTRMRHPLSPGTDFAVMESARNEDGRPLYDPRAFSRDSDVEPDVLPAVMHALSELPDAHRQVVVLYGSGYSYARIAALTGVSVGTVRSRLHYSRRQLVPALAAYR